MSLEHMMIKCHQNIKKCHRGQVTGGGSPNTGNNQIKDSTMDNGGN